MTRYTVELKKTKAQVRDTDMTESTKAAKRRPESVRYNSVVNGLSSGVHVFFLSIIVGRAADERLNGEYFSLRGDILVNLSPSRRQDFGCVPSVLRIAQP